MEAFFGWLVYGHGGIGWLHEGGQQRKWWSRPPLCRGGSLTGIPHHFSLWLLYSVASLSNFPQFSSFSAFFVIGVGTIEMGWAPLLFGADIK